ncbi:uncharacterized protein BO66DRAFT_227616 [Aspergillus aculeatinus CBS 121060]|uniref:Uncharacterized protein n=1 Tax=Aspergillus aculeatinus CBS 121060 TaxID=1448322 RepID=A0ACD1GUL5_9EURO|nr:hypothetical protein BO66DRAFT_227616 [Aspergillus aculeatinus CBS 121060]RAH64966.1 hypothetical protein BO66DRAFT_227616 [Aspergillus aculeatinus CBS 121060]
MRFALLQDYWLHGTMSARERIFVVLSIGITTFSMVDAILKYSILQFRTVRRYDRHDQSIRSRLVI